MSLEVLRLEGEYYSMGTQHGGSLGHLIRDLAEERIDIICSSYPRVTLALLKDVCEEVLDAIQRQVSEVYEEIEGIAYGANIPLWMIVIAEGFSDIDHRASSVIIDNTNNPLHECTLMPVRDEFGEILLAGTWDSHATAEAALVLIERRPIKAPATLALTTAGCPMQQGVTSEGLGFAIANVVPLSSKRGITYAAALPKIAAQTNVRNAANMSKKFQLCSGRFYALCDKSGNYAGIETDGYQYWVTRKLEVHTNHYIHKNAKSIEGRILFRQYSEARRFSAEKKLSRLDHINIDNLFDILSFNDKTTASIAQLGHGREDRSGASFVINPHNCTISFTVGPPGLSAPRTIQLKC